jgi:hypothetical protein
MRRALGSLREQLSRCVLRPHAREEVRYERKSKQGAEGPDCMVDKRSVQGVGDPSRHIEWARGHNSRITSHDRSGLHISHRS